MKEQFFFFGTGAFKKIEALIFENLEFSARPRHNFSRFSIKRILNFLFLFVYTDLPRHQPRLLFSKESEELLVVRMKPLIYPFALHSWTHCTSLQGTRAWWGSLRSRLMSRRGIDVRSVPINPVLQQLIPKLLLVLAGTTCTAVVFALIRPMKVARVV